MTYFLNVARQSDATLSLDRVFQKLVAKGKEGSVEEARTDRGRPEMTKRREECGYYDTDHAHDGWPRELLFLCETQVSVESRPQNCRLVHCHFTNPRREGKNRN